MQFTENLQLPRRGQQWPYPRAQRHNSEDARTTNETRSQLRTPCGTHPGLSSLNYSHTLKVSRRLRVPVRKNYTVKMDRCLRSRSASTAREENAASWNLDSATQEITLSNEPGLCARNTETNIREGVDLFDNSMGTSGRDETPVLVHQLQSMFAAFVTAMQVENAKLFSN